MKQRHIVEAGMVVLSGVIALVVALMWLAGTYSVTLMTAMAVLIMLGVLVGGVIPNILITWLAIGTTTIGAAILLLGYVVMDNWVKLVLLATFPVMSSAMALARFVIGSWGWLDRNREDIDSWAAHYDKVIKLQTEYNAGKYYQKVARFVTKEVAADLHVDVLAIHWAHSSQIRQFNEDDYLDNLHQIAKVLKAERFPSEQLYYIGGATFLIISLDVSPTTYEFKNRAMMRDLWQLTLDGTTPQFQWGHLQVDRQNVLGYPNLERVLRHVEREMETDLVVEYMKQEVVN
ncbi:UNVERIFIED_CONTAM: hypothetical protein DV033_05450 [Limosilactobacillus fermentum]|uniref:Uncharacterized protein n=1 Tax=Limosilactobacillus fermentum TaxID=1613 RepID=A0AAJ6D3M9_LIMFE|nr:hypothetical protein [Limosilactobacillus fermentum]MED7635213.1 hypothetical protein [Limosilactobacillus fermentum]WFR89045.1 hypothetical protein P8634_09910 [Limosilactobacillus fermentum]